MPSVALMWFRKDLRLADNEALTAAAAHAETVACIAIDRRSADPSPASQRWRAASHAALDLDLRPRGSTLALLDEPPRLAIPRIAEGLGASSVFCSRDFDPRAAEEEEEVANALRPYGCELVRCQGQLLVPPGQLRTASGGPFRVFTPFFHAWIRALTPDVPLPVPDRIPAPAEFAEGHGPPPASQAGLAPPTRDGAGWTAGEREALARLDRFARGPLAEYGEGRDRPDVDGTSELSPRIALGELSVRQVVATAVSAVGESVALPFLRQLAWREFAYHVLADFPHLDLDPWRPEFAAMPWSDDVAGSEAWRDGLTGFPLVDAGMRQLAATGWMHNRVRLVAASFLTKDLLLPWQTGERFFAERLADYDPAANAFNWQWVAGSGADASPYSRIFNPVTQGSRFDPHGDYVRRWVPELAHLDAKWIHQPWAAPDRALRQAHVTIGGDYPAPILDHAEARRRALAAFGAVRSARNAR